jgi:hypothetical protein
VKGERLSGVHLALRGVLKPATRSKTRREAKHKLREHFHKQLKELWTQKPLDALHEATEPDGKIIPGGL